MANINYDPFNDVTDPDAAVAAINISLASLFPPTAINPFVTLDDLASIKQINTARILGRYTAGVGTVEEITIGANLTLSPLGVLSASGGGGTLAATLILGNTSGATNIIMDLGQSINASSGGGQLDLAWFSTPDYVGLTNDAGVGLSGIVELYTDYAGLSHAGSEVGVNQYMMGTEYLYDISGIVPQNTANLWSTSSAIGVPASQAIINIGVAQNYSATYTAYQDISIQDNSTFAAGIGTGVGVVRNAIFIGTENVRLDIGVQNSVVIGGSFGNALLAASDTVYIGNNLSVMSTSVTAAMSFVAATTTMTIGASLPGTNGTLNMVGQGVGGAPRINMTGGTNGTAGMNVTSGAAASIQGYYGTYANIPGSSYRNGGFGILAPVIAGNPRMFLWQQNVTREIVLLVNSNDASNTVNVGVMVRQDNVVIQRIYDTTAPPVLTAKLNIGGSTLALAAMNIQTSALIPTAPGAGDMWYNGTDLFLDNGALTATTRQKVARVLTGSATLDFPNTAAFSFSDLTITVTGAAGGDCVSVGIPNGSIPANILYFAWVSAANTVTVRFINNTAVASNPASGTFKVTVFKN